MKDKWRNMAKTVMEGRQQRGVQLSEAMKEQVRLFAPLLASCRINVMSLLDVSQP
jgi:hypothetical protein